MTLSKPDASTPEYRFGNEAQEPMGVLRAFLEREHAQAVAYMVTEERVVVSGKRLGGESHLEQLQRNEQRLRNIAMDLAEGEFGKLEYYVNEVGQETNREAARLDKEIRATQFRTQTEQESYDRLTAHLKVLEDQRFTLRYYLPSIEADSSELMTTGFSGFKFGKDHSQLRRQVEALVRTHPESVSRFGEFLAVGVAGIEDAKQVLRGTGAKGALRVDRMNVSERLNECQEAKSALDRMKELAAGS